MEVNEVVAILQEIRAAYPSLTNDEVLKIMNLKILLEIKVALNR